MLNERNKFALETLAKSPVRHRMQMVGPTKVVDELLEDMEKACQKQRLSPDQKAIMRQQTEDLKQNREEAEQFLAGLLGLNG